jgi:hypothetical protein
MSPAVTARNPRPICMTSRASIRWSRLTGRIPNWPPSACSLNFRDFGIARGTSRRPVRDNVVPLERDPATQGGGIGRHGASLASSPRHAAPLPERSSLRTDAMAHSLLLFQLGVSGNPPCLGIRWRPRREWLTGGAALGQPSAASGAHCTRTLSAASKLTTASASRGAGPGMPSRAFIATRRICSATGSENCGNGPKIPGGSQSLSCGISSLHDSSDAGAGTDL